MWTPRHFPGFEQHQHLQAFTCRCPECGKQLEIFSDEFDREHHCSGCGKAVDFSRRRLESGA